MPATSKVGLCWRCDHLEIVSRYREDGKTYSFNWCGILGYDAEEWTRRWLRTNGNAEYKTFETLSLLEVALVDERFAAVRPFIGYADLFFSHAGDHTVQ